MKNKGYTLIELLGVMVILALMVVISFPSIVNFIKSSKTSTEDLTLNLVKNATELYLEEYAEYSDESDINMCIPLEDLTDLGYLKRPIKLENSDEDITEIKSVKVTYDNELVYDIVDKNFCSELVVDLEESLVPVKYNGSAWIITKATDEQWYDYENQEWANAVILAEGVKKNIGDTITVDGTSPDAVAMFVYVPRYEYKIEGVYGIHSDGVTVGTQLLPGEIKVNFISKNRVDSYDGYRVHPAFSFGDEELSGIWVGKFETSHETLSSSTKYNNLECQNEHCTNASGLRILPNVVSLRNNNVSNFYFAIRSMEYGENEFGIAGDAHMMKNSEWGAVAYLSQSKYGKYGNQNYTGSNKEIYQNKSSSYITGSSNGTPSQDTYRTTQCAYDDTTNNCGVGASTTGNITGIYDMSGGAWEYVMGYLTTASTIWGSTSNSNYAGFTSTLDSKYYDGYTEYGMSDLGHALSETSVSSSVIVSWYNDYSSFISTSDPWLRRGGFYSNNNVGMFYFNYYSGYSSNNGSARVVLVNTM